MFENSYELHICVPHIFLHGLFLLVILLLRLTKAMEIFSRSTLAFLNEPTIYFTKIQIQKRKRKRKQYDGHCSREASLVES